MENHIITVKDFENAWGDALSPFVQQKINEYNLEYSPLTSHERDDAILRMVEFLLSDFVVYAGEHRQDQWESGWGENLNEFIKTHDIASTIPRYFGKYPITRFRQQLIRGKSKAFELEMLSILQYWVFEKYLKSFPIVYEFGCGTGNNLLRLREVNRNAHLWGLDWATSSQRLIGEISHVIGDEKLKAHHFDYFHPDPDVNLDPDGALYTFASLEQTGTRYDEFVNYILKNKPKLCVNIEPTGESLDKNNLLDYLSIKYFEKRKYLDGFIAHLRNLEAAGQAEIINIQRSFIGSFYIDGYTLIVWRPL